MERPKRHVFVIDDDPAFLNAVMRLIRVADFTVEGYPAISAFRERFPLQRSGCVLVDIILDGENGLDVPDVLLAANEKLPVVFMSATEDPNTIDAAGRRSGHPCLKKPIEAQDLFAALEAAFDASGNDLPPPQKKTNNCERKTDENIVPINPASGDSCASGGLGTGQAEYPDDHV